MQRKVIEGEQCQSLQILRRLACTSSGGREAGVILLFAVPDHRCAAPDALWESELNFLTSIAKIFFSSQTTC